MHICYWNDKAVVYLNIKNALFYVLLSFHIHENSSKVEF